MFVFEFPRSLNELEPETMFAKFSCDADELSPAFCFSFESFDFHCSKVMAILPLLVGGKHLFKKRATNTALARCRRCKFFVGLVS